MANITGTFTSATMQTSTASTAVVSSIGKFVSDFDGSFRVDTVSIAKRPALGQIYPR